MDFRIGLSTKKKPTDFDGDWIDLYLRTFPEWWGSWPNEPELFCDTESHPLCCQVIRGKRDLSVLVAECTYRRQCSRWKIILKLPSSFCLLLPWITAWKRELVKSVLVATQCLLGGNKVDKLPQKNRKEWRNGKTRNPYIGIYVYIYRNT